MTKVLLTGFEPFDSEPINPSWEAVRTLDGERLDGCEIVGRGLSVTFADAGGALHDYLDEIQPDLVICVGLAGGRSAFSVERVAINVNDGRIPDNAGFQPVDERIREDGPVGYWSSLPIKAIVRDVREAGIPAEVSQTAGTYVCNFIFYTLMDELQQREGVRGGFIHVPLLPEQATRQPGQPSLGLAEVIKALRIAVHTSVTHREDIREAEGAVS